MLKNIARVLAGWGGRLHDAWKWAVLPLPPNPPIVVAKRDDRDADLEVLLAEVADLHCRSMRRSPRRRPELNALLQGAVYAGAHDPVKGRLLFEKALARFQETTQTTNRMAFMLGAIGGVVGGIFFASELIELAGKPTAYNLTDPATIASLCFFSLVGSLTSIFMRSSKLDLRTDDSLAYVLISGFVQPFIALGFVAVLFIIIKYQVLGITVSAEHLDGVLWAAAFLCGFSERFAPGILDSAAATFAAKAPS